MDLSYQSIQIPIELFQIAAKLALGQAGTVATVWIALTSA
jgi:hypothetical protein